MEFELRDTPTASRQRRSVTLQRGLFKEVVGESNHQNALRQMARGFTEDGPADRHHMVELRRERDNPFDPDAVRVLAGDRTVGHIPRDRTSDYHALLDWAEQRGLSVLTRSELVGGFERRDGGRAHLGIYLTHASPPGVAYDGPAPTLHRADADDHYARVNVIGEQHVQEQLSALVHRNHLATLAVGRDGIVAVSIRDTEVGSLSAKMSDRYAPMVAEALARSGAATSFALVYQGPHKIEVVLKLPQI